MSNQDIIATLHRERIRTVGDLDRWRGSKLTRWQALTILVGVKAADRIIGALAVKQCRREIA